MKKLIITVLSFAAVATNLVAAERVLDLRGAVTKGAKSALLAAPTVDKGVLRQTRLAAKAALLPTLEVGDSIAFTLFDDVKLSVRLKERLETTQGGESFIASVAGYDGLANAVVIQTKEGLQVDVQDFRKGRVYTVVSSAEATMVREIDPKAGEITPCQSVVPESNGTVEIVTPKRTLMAVASTSQSANVVDILVAYDKGAASWTKNNGGGMQSFALTAVAKMNAALANNGLDASFRFRLVGTTEVDASASDVNAALYAVRDDEAGWAAIKTKRDEVGADIVTVLIDTGTAYGTTGVGWSLETTDFSSFADSAYNVCSVRAVAQSHTMTHEVGHNMGAGHATNVNPEKISPGPQLYDYSSGYHFMANGTAYHTIMAYDTDGYSNSYDLAPLFSSPDATWEGVAVGDVTHDNARTIRNTYVAASKWRAQKVPLSYDVFFSPETETLFTSSVTVTLTPGKDGLSIRYTTDGSEPTLSSALYSGPIIVTATTTIKAAAITDGKLGPVYEARYLKSNLGTALNAPQLNWTTSTDYPWSTQTENAFDGFAVQSCAAFVDVAGCGKTSWLKTTVTGPVEMGFRYQKRQYLSSFKVYCDSQVVWSDSDDGNDLNPVYNWNRAMVSLPAGVHEVKFAFEQGYGYYGGFNGIALDTVCFDNWSASPSISPDTSASQESAKTFTGSMTVSLMPPQGRAGTIFYTLDGSDPTLDGALTYSGPFVIDRSVFVQAVFVEQGREPSPPAKGYFLERHPVKPGEWTTDVDGAKAAAAKDGRLIAVLCANRAGCWWSQQFMPVAENPEFLAWAAANGVYLITSDSSELVDTEAAFSYFCALYEGYGISYPTLVFADPKNPDVCLAWGLARNDSRSTIGGIYYKDTVDSLVRGFAAVMGESTVPDAPLISPTVELIDAFPLTVTLTNPNSSGMIYYTLDGSEPTKTGGVLYVKPFTVSFANVTIKAAVWPANGLSSPVAVRSYSTIPDLLGTSGIVWTNDSNYPWSYDAKTHGLRSCYRSGASYTSKLKASVSGKGRLSFRLKASSNSSQNVIRFKLNDTVKFSFGYNPSDGTAKTQTYDLMLDGTMTLEWSYQVSNAGYNFSGNGVVVDQIVWTPEPEGETTTTPVAVPHAWIAERFPGVAVDAYEMLMGADSDGDGFSNWQEYLCGTNPNDAGTNGDSVPRCTITMVNGLPQVDHNIVIPSAAQAVGWRAVMKGSSGDFRSWSAANTTVHKLFKVVIEQE